jgi:hypothetical protein
MLAAMDENEGAIAERQLKRGMTLAVGSSFALGVSICMLVRDVGESRLDGVLLWVAILLMFISGCFRGVSIIRTAVKP